MDTHSLLWCSAFTRFGREALLLTVHPRTSVFIKYFKTVQSEFFMTSGGLIPVFQIDTMWVRYLTVILRGRAGYELIYITNEAVGRVGYYQLISGKSEKNNCFSKFSSNSRFFRVKPPQIFSDLQNFSTRNSPSVFPYLVKLNDNGSYYWLREPIRKLENHYPELKMY